MLVLGTRVRLIAALVTVSLMAACDRQITPANQTEQVIGLLPTSGEGSAFIQSEQRHYVRASGGVTTGKALDTSSAWTLEYALSGGGGNVQGGDSVFLLGGEYVPPGPDGYTVNLAGAAGSRIVFLGYPGQVPVLNARQLARVRGMALLKVQSGASFLRFSSIVLMDSDQGSRGSSSVAGVTRPHLIVNYGDNIEFIALVLHDGGIAFYNEADASNQADNTLIAGSVFYNNGWWREDTSLTGEITRNVDGHALYVKNHSSAFVARANVMFNQVGYGVHAYSELGGYLDNMTFRRNVSFNNGTLAGGTGRANILLGGKVSASGTVDSNLLYHGPAYQTANLHVGYQNYANGSVNVRRNHVVGGRPAFDLGYWSSATIQYDTLVWNAGNLLVWWRDPTLGYTCSSNRHNAIETNSLWRYAGNQRTNLATWMGTTNCSSDAAMGAPVTRLQVDSIMPGHAIISIAHGNGATIGVPLPGGILSSGDSFVVRNVMNLDPSIAPAASGTYSGGNILLSTASMPAPTPYGTDAGPSGGTVLSAYVLTRIPRAGAPLAATSVTVVGAMISSAPYTSDSVVPQGGYCEFQVNAVNPVANATITLFWNDRQDSIVGIVGDAFYPAMLSSGTMVFEMRASKAGYTSVWSPPRTIYVGSGDTCLL